MKTPPFRKKLKRFACSILAFGVTLVSAHASSIALFLPDSLESGNWTVAKYSNPAVDEYELQGDTWLRIARTATNNGSAQVMYTGEGQQLADFTGSVILGINTASSYGTGVVLRAQGVGFTNTSSYFLSVVPSTSKLALYWGGGETFLPPRADSTWTELASADLDDPLGILGTTQNHQYLLEFSFIDNQLEASLAVWDTETQQKGTVLATLSFTESDISRPTAGYFGVRGGRYGGNVSSYFREIQVQAVPEPSAAAMILLSVGGVLRYRKIARR